MNIRIVLPAALVLAGSLALSAPVAAATVTATSYSMPNGDGTASKGSYDYWDDAYTGSGSKTVDGAALTGGVGDLTDGVVATDFWYNTEASPGGGPYVGWYEPATLDPTVTFNFSGSPTINGIRIHVDNSGVGGVFTPASILVDGVSQVFSGPSPGSIGWINLSGLNLTGGSHTVQFFQAPATWTFVSEIKFDGKGGVPEPATWAMMIAGFGLAGTALRRRRAITA